MQAAAAAGSPPKADLLLAAGAAANAVPPSTLSSPADVPPSQQQQQASDEGVSPVSLSPDGTPQQSALLYGTRSAGLPLGKVGVLTRVVGVHCCSVCGSDTWCAGGAQMALDDTVTCASAAMCILIYEECCS